MRKRSKYRPKPVLRNPMGYVKESVTLLSSFDSKADELKLKNHIAFEAVCKGQGTKHDVDVLIAAVNMADGLASTAQHGKDYAPHIRLAHDAMFNLGTRGVKTGRFVLTGPELRTMQLLMELHDAQLEITTVRELELAVQYVRSIIATGKARKIPCSTEKETQHGPD